jgi:hypothetical protein
MIQLDTNYLIGSAVRGSFPAEGVDKWPAEGKSPAASTPAGTEFLNGPVSAEEITLVESVIEGRLLPFDKATAILAQAGFATKTEMISRHLFFLD